MVPGTESLKQRERGVRQFVGESSDILFVHSPVMAWGEKLMARFG